eukprot:CAMPEP_0196758424 /NCGR_PEP_ID=MMETSP1091-20130531/104167_1 /TAXON_ID=302021 /ORGANISM="Rhodomonas sp., Strain CCMP768" /LENGTH=203 /DNA_ID=CAMNT_0042107247 /DNA_START=114 /DNA_END=727 /DNA_ORIENTATION=+
MHAAANLPDEGDDLVDECAARRLGHRDLDALHLDHHLVVHALRLDPVVLLGSAAAPAVVEHRDHRRVLVGRRKEYNGIKSRSEARRVGTSDDMRSPDCTEHSEVSDFLGDSLLNRKERWDRALKEHDERKLTMQIVLVSESNHSGKETSFLNAQTTRENTEKLMNPTPALQTRHVTPHVDSSSRISARIVPPQPQKTPHQQQV